MRYTTYTPTTSAPPPSPPTPAAQSPPAGGHAGPPLPYGAVRWSDGTLPTDYGHTGQRADTTGLMYYHARYYDAALGRFVSADTVVPDPSRPRDLNRYAYAANSPLRFVDPSGHRICEDWDCLKPEVPEGWPPPPAREPSQSPDIIYVGLAARELGPHYVMPFWPEDHPKYGQSTLDDLFSPWPPGGRDSLIQCGTYGEVLWRIYGGPEGLQQTVAEACASFGCNNPAIGDDWSGHSPEIHQYLASQFYGVAQNPALAMFLTELHADPHNFYNYEPLFMEELQRQHFYELSFAQWDYVNQLYLGHRLEWWESNFGFKGGKTSP